MSDNEGKTAIDCRDNSEQMMYNKDPRFEGQNNKGKFTRWIGHVKEQINSTYAKRSAIANVLVTLLWIAGIIPALFLLMTGIFALFPFLVENSQIFVYIVSGLILVYFSAFYIYYSTKFLLGNQKDAKLPFLLGALSGCYLLVVLLSVVNTPTYELNEMDSGDYLLGLLFAIIPALIMVGIYYGLIKLVLKIKKDGASAWSLFEPKTGKRGKFDRLVLIIFLVLWAVIAIVVVCSELTSCSSSSSPTEEQFPSHETAKIGDYYYQDGTVSSELLPNKKPIGIVFSLETPKHDKKMGFGHGQIVSLTDISDDKMSYEYFVSDNKRYPNYTWDNRLDALKDYNGLYYTYCNDEGGALDMNWAAMDYQENENEGITHWYVPTAGQWALILENLGGTKVDKMLKFDSEKASRNLKKVKIDPKKYYWTITEFDEDNAWSIRVANGEFGSSSDKKNTAYVRPVASF